LRGLLQLLEEYQYHFSSSTSQSLNAIRARRRTNTVSGRGGASGMGSEREEDSERIAPTLQRVGGKVLYEHLLTPHLAHGLSGVQVLLSLCEQMGKIYRKLAECTAQPSASPAMHEALARVDSLLEEHLIAPATKHADALAKATVRTSLGRLDPLFAKMWGQATATDADDKMERQSRVISGAL